MAPRDCGQNKPVQVRPEPQYVPVLASVLGMTQEGHLGVGLTAQIKKCRVPPQTYPVGRAAAGGGVPEREPKTKAEEKCHSRERCGGWMLYQPWEEQ